MNNLAFQIYGTKKATPFQSVWKTDNIALGGELANRAASSLPTDWSGTNLLTGGYTHNGSGSSELLFSIGSAALQNYQIVCTLSAGSTGSVVIGLGNVSSVAISATTTIILTPTVGSGTLKITPVNFVGTVSLSVKQISSAVNQIQLPITSIPIGKSIWIDWGDNSYTNANNGNIIANRTHTYSTPGEYTVRILGDNFNFIFIDGFTNDRLKIKSISSWGKLKLIAGSFRNCSNVTMSGITDIPDLTGVTSLNATFLGCSAITTVGRMNEWNTSSVTNLSSMFEGARLFNQPIGNWDVSNVTTMRYMFQGGAIPMSFNQNIGSWDVRNVVNFDNFVGTANAKSSFNNGGSPDINNWIINTSADVNMAGMFSNCTDFNQPLNLWNTSRVTNMSGMFGSWVSPMKFNNGFASGDGIGNQLSWNTSNVTNMSFMFSNNPAFNSNLGTGTTPWDVSKVTTFASMFQGASKFNNGDEDDVTKSKINDWSINIVSNVSMTNMFYGVQSGVTAFNREISKWNMSKVTSLSGMFWWSSAFNNGLNTSTNPTTGRTGINGWNINTSSPVTMDKMFAGTKDFNRPLLDWDTSTVTTMDSMFYGVTNYKFNQDISKWNVGNVTSFTNMFTNSFAFNNGDNLNTNPITGLQGIDGWNINTVSNVVMNSMFLSAIVFNRPIESWNMTKVINTSSMFNSAIAFNQPLDNWERPGSTTGNVTSMNGMFRGAATFNGLVDTWNVSKVTNMQAMFHMASRFNKPLANWERSTPGNTSTLANVTLFSEANIYVGMFGLATDFNQPIGNWNTSKVTRMNYMFRSATSFNQSIDAWDVSSVWDMEGMFNNASSFNKPLGSWNLSKISNMASMFEGANTFNNGLAAGLSGTFTWNINTISDINMSRMFPNLGVFNQNIGAWNVSQVTNFTNFMLGKTPSTYSSTNLDAIYNGWIVNGVKPNISSPLSTNISFGTAKYSQAGKPGRDTLLASPNNWIITDGGNENALTLDAGNPLSYPGTGTLWTDLSGSNNNGTLINGPTFDSANGGSIVFDGNDDYVNCGNASNLQITVGTISAWVKTTTPGSDYRGIIVKQFNWGLFVRDNILVAYDWGPSIVRTTGINISDGTWKNITMTFTETVGTPSNNAIVYLNGNPVLTTTIKYSNNTINVELGRGGSSGIGASQLLNGSISEAKIYNRVLSSTEILANFNATKGRYGL